MEQYLMKAMHFKDTDIASKIMLTQDSVQQKAYGKKVADFDKKIWHNDVPGILLKGLRAKFFQDILCKEFLRATGQRIIGEANPTDGFFGIAIGLRDSKVWDVDKWGNNLLGKSLMEIRSEL